MQNRQPAGSMDGDQAQLLMALAGILILCVMFFDIFVFWTSWILYWLWIMIDVGPLHSWVAGKANLLVKLSQTAETATFDAWLSVMNQTSGILFLFLGPIVLMSAISLAQHPMLPFRSKRLVNAKTLPKLVSSFAPSVIPIVAAYGPNGLKDDTSAINAWAAKPEEFAELHGLITRKVLNRQAAQSIFEAQIGPNHSYLDSWSPHEKALLAVFGLQVFLNDRKAATKLLDDLNRSCAVKGLLRRRNPHFLPLYSLADTGFSRVIASAGFKGLLTTHRAKRTVLAGLYGQDLRLPSARFRWLKGVDRTLWYALHSADTMKVFVEGAGVLAQARAESQAYKLGLPCDVLMVKKAVDGLQAELESIGLVHSYETAPVEAVPEKAVPLMDAIYSAAPLPTEQ
ncbi:conjugal transfer protein [Pseudomonas syringae]|nr:conjugal transfer protein [Pseudomonas syringae]MBD8803236.1 conjugal transfer protein [Pseudomonas syringae]MBD8814056.1 conjugal transfer protein [Pseudomonas syringae]